jgi:hypothetical protein
MSEGRLDRSGRRVLRADKKMRAPGTDMGARIHLLHGGINRTGESIV